MSEDSNQPASFSLSLDEMAQQSIQQLQWLRDLPNDKEKWIKYLDLNTSLFEISDNCTNMRIVPAIEVFIRGLDNVTGINLMSGQGLLIRVARTRTTEASEQDNSGKNPSDVKDNSTNRKEKDDQEWLSNRKVKLMREISERFPNVRIKDSIELIYEHQYQLSKPLELC